MNKLNVNVYFVNAGVDEEGVVLGLYSITVTADRNRL